eukprot:4909584-Pleurochrysis_carterae.AAC.2
MLPTCMISCPSSSADEGGGEGRWRVVGGVTGRTAYKTTMWGGGVGSSKAQNEMQLRDARTTREYYASAFMCAPSIDP